jgi:hypothetical protein
MNIFQLSKNLERGIISAMHNRRAPDGLRGNIAAGSFDAVREHHGSVNLLIDKGKNGSAFALLRSMLDGCIVGLWATYIASDKILEKFEAGRFTVEPQKVIKQLKPRDDGDYTDTLQRIYDQSWKPFCTYVHGGSLQVSRRNAAEYIGLAYSDEEIKEVLIFSNAMLIIAAMEVPTLTNDHEFSGEINQVINVYLQAVATNQVQPTADVSADL